MRAIARDELSVIYDLRFTIYAMVWQSRRFYTVSSHGISNAGAPAGCSRRGHEAEGFSSPLIRLLTSAATNPACTAHGARIASAIPWMIFLSAGLTVASTPPSCGRAA